MQTSAYISSLFLLCVTVNSTVTASPLPTTAEWISDYTDILSKFSLRTAEIPDDDMCYLVAGQPETIEECEFNRETQTFIVIHGWTVCQEHCRKLCKIHSGFVAVCCENLIW